MADYPHHFSVETDAEIAWLSDYVEAHDWIVPSVYISDQETEIHNYTFNRLRDLGLVPMDALRPEIDAVHGPGAHDGHSEVDDDHSEVDDGHSEDGADSGADDDHSEADDGHSEDGAGG